MGKYNRSTTEPTVDETTETTELTVEETTEPTVEETTEPTVDETTEPTVEETTETTEPTVEETTETTEPTVDETTEPTVDETTELTVDETTKTTEPTVDETTVIPQPTNVVNTLDTNAIAALLANPNMSVGDKIEEIKLNGSVPFKLLVSKLVSYNEIMSPTAPALDSAKGAGRNFDLYSVLKSLVSEDDYGTFKVKFDIVNLYFKEFKSGAYSEFMLFRHSEGWKWGKENFTTYSNLITVITNLCDMSTRQAKLKTILLEKAFNKTDTVLNDTAINNLIKYYRA